MAKIENTVFISYRRTDVYTALAVYENLKNQGYDVFFDYRSISSGDFEQIIIDNIKARAHFILILTPTALDRCSEPGDWLRREIEIAVDEKRNIIPLFFKGFRFGTPSVSEKSTGKLGNLSRYNGLNVHEDYFDEGMQRLRIQYLNLPLGTILHPVSTEVQKAVREEKIAADKALEQIEDVKGLMKQTEEESVRSEQNELRSKVDVPVRREIIESPGFNFRFAVGVAGGVLLLALLLWGGVNAFQNQLGINPVSTSTSQMVITQSIPPLATDIPLPTQVPLSPAPTLGIGSTMPGKDGMTLFYVPAGEFIMGSDTGADDEKPIHTVYLDAFWIDKTEVTLHMYYLCVVNGVCKAPANTASPTRSSYYGNSAYDNYPVIYVDWDMAKTYCTWANRRLPTEAEWEKAARGTNALKYPWGNGSPNNALLNYGRFVGDPTEVGKYPNGASIYGALDLAGNVWEWVNDWYSDTYYPSSPSSNPLGPDSGQDRVLRGGSYYVDDSGVRSTLRFKYNPVNTTNSDDVGFRCALSATP